MDLTHYRLRLFILLVRDELARALFRVRALFLVLISLVAFVALGYLSATHSAEIEASVRLVETGLSLPRNQLAVQNLSLQWLPEALRVLRSAHGNFWLFQVAALLWVPVVITLLSFDVVAADLSSGRVRFLVQRVPRVVYLLAKYAAHLMLGCGLYLSGAILFIGVESTFGFDMRSIQDGLRCLGLIVSLGALFVFITVFTVLVSSWCRTPTRAMFSVNFWWIVIAVAGAFWPWLSPLQTEWLRPAFLPSSATEISAAIFAQLTISLALVLCGVWQWQRKDL